MPEKKEATEPVSLGVRLRRAALFVLFALVLLIPKTLALRRRRRWWTALRLLLALTGAVLLTGVGAEPVAWGSALVGLLLLLLALLVPPVKEGKSVDEQARELGALVVLNGGRFWDATGEPTETRLFVAAERVHVLDLQHRPLLEIPLAALVALRVEQADPSTSPLDSAQDKLGVTKEAKEAREAKGSWRLVVEWQGGRAAFSYGGFFAEHLAQVAETTLRGQLRRELPVVQG